MPDIFSIFSNALLLMRLHSSTGYLLAFFPASFGLLLASNGKMSDFAYLPLFLLGSIVTRASGCIINDIIDRDFDKKVQRTKFRPLATGSATVKEALIILGFNLFVALIILLTLNVTCILVGFVALIMMSIYPFMKRITHFPQVFLGITFNLGSLIGYASIQNSISEDAMLLYIACGFWTVAYDTIYAFADIKDDKTLGLYSTAIFFEKKKPNIVIGACYFIFIALLAFVFRASMGATMVSALLLSIVMCASLVTDLDTNNPTQCLQKFKYNSYIGAIVFIGILLEKIHKQFILLV